MNAPFSCPNSSEASKDCGIAAQLTRMNARLAAPGAIVDRTGDELFARSRLALDQNRRVGRRHFRDLIQHRPERIRGADDLFEHRRTHDLFSQCDILVPRSVFRSFTLVDVGSRRIPADQAPLFVMEGVIADEEPAILPFLAQRP